MALFQPSQIVPDARSGLGLGVVDATQDLTVSWHINGASAMTAFEIVIYENNAASTQVLDTGMMTNGCPAYGTASNGDPQFFSYTIDAADLASAGMVNGAEYKLVITQWWSVSDSVTQTSASAFVTRATPTLAVDTIGSTAEITSLVSDINVQAGATQAVITNNTHSYIVSFGGKTAGKGTLDATNGELTITHGVYTFTGNETWNINASQTGYQTTVINSLVKKPASTSTLADITSTVLPTVTQASIVTGVSTTGIAISSTGAILIAAADYANVSQLTGTTLVYALATIETSSVTPITVAVIDGQNNVSSSTGDVTVDVTIDGVTTTYSGAVVTFNAPAAGEIFTRSYTFTGTYTQAEGDVLNWFCWRIALADNTDDPFFDSGNVSGTMQLSCTYDGFFTGTNYAIRLTAQTENGVDLDTGWVNFSANYSVIAATGGVTASCVAGTDAVLVSWKGINYIEGKGTGPYSISEDYVLTLPEGSTVLWDEVTTDPMSFDAPWSVVWKGSVQNSDVDIFTIGQSGGDITLSYDVDTQSIVLAQNGTTIVSQSGIINEPDLTVVLTETALYIRAAYMYGGLYPDNALYPDSTLYPADDTTLKVDTYTLSPSYTQTAITSVELGGYQTCDYIEVINGTASADTVTAAITNGTYAPDGSETDYLLATWTDGINAGSLNTGGDTIQGFAVYRRQGAGGSLVHVADTDAQTTEIYDYGATSQQGPYTYYIFPIGTSTYISAPIESVAVSPCWWNWTLMECTEDSDGIYTVLSAYRFRLNVETGPVGNNNAPAVLPNFTPYPKVQLAPQNYKSSSLSGLIGAVDWSTGQPKYMDTIALRDAIYALSLTQNPLFLKNRKGDLLRVRIAGAISMQTGDATREQTQTATIPWVEVGDTDGVSLYSLQNAG